MYEQLGTRVFYFMLYPVVAFQLCVRKNERRGIQQFWRNVRREEPSLYQCFMHFFRYAETLLDKNRVLLRAEDAPNCRVTGTEIIEDRKYGCIIITSHMSCLELCSTLVDKNKNINLIILMHGHFKFLNQYRRYGINKCDREHIDDSNERMQWLDLSTATAGTALTLNRHLESGGHIVITGDRVQSGERKKIQVPFFGLPAYFSTIPYILANRFEVPIIMMTCRRELQGYHLHFEKLIEKVSWNPSGRKARLIDYTRQYVDRLQLYVDASPIDWCNFYMFWGDDR